MGDYKAIGKAFADYYYNAFDKGPRENVAALYVSFFRLDFTLRNKKKLLLSK